MDVGKTVDSIYATVPVVHVEALQPDLNDDVSVRQQDGVAVGAGHHPSLVRPGPGVDRKLPVQVVRTYARRNIDAIGSFSKWWRLELVVEPEENEKVRMHEP